MLSNNTILDNDGNNVMVLQRQAACAIKASILDSSGNQWLQM